MRTLLVLLLLAPTLALVEAAPADPAPTVAVARGILQQRIARQSAGRIRLIDFKSPSGPKPAPWDNDGERRFLVTYVAEIEFLEACCWDSNSEHEPVTFTTHKPGTMGLVPNRVFAVEKTGERFLIRGQIALKGAAAGWDPTGFTWSDPPQRLVKAQAQIQEVKKPTAKPVQPPYPSDVLENQILKVRYYLPDGEHGYYRGTRFDWSGLISQVDYAGHRFFCEFKQAHDPLNHDDICGTAEEFGINNPAGYSEAKPGGVFLKVGIGLLEKLNSEPYNFAHRYRIAQEGQWHLDKQPNQVEFRQDFKGPEGWAYSYTKTLLLDPHAPVLRITRVLKNEGTRTIETDHYGHNFLKIDELPAGPEYLIRYPFVPRLGEASRPGGFVEIRDRSVAFLKELPPGESVWLRIEGFAEAGDNRITLRNRRSNAAMEIATDQPATRMAFFSQGGVLSPEPFIAIRVAPGATQTWTTSYTFSVGADR